MSKTTHPLDWKQNHGKLAEALMGTEYIGSPRMSELQESVAEVIDAGFPLRQIIDHIAGLELTLEEYTSLIFSVGVYDGARNGTQYGRPR